MTIKEYFKEVNEKVYCFYLIVIPSYSNEDGDTTEHYCVNKNIIEKYSDCEIISEYLSSHDGTILTIKKKRIIDTTKTPSGVRTYL